MADEERPIYSIGVVKDKTGLTGRQIRYYEECELINPARTKGNQRIYSDQDIERLKKIKKLLADGLNIAGVKQKLGTASEAQSKEEDSESPAYDGRPLTKFSRGQQKGLTSLYPVSNRGQLYEVLGKYRAEEEEE